MTARGALFGLVPALVLVMVAAFTWFDVTHLSPSECRDEEATQFPRLERVAQEVMGPVGDRFSRYSSCEDSGAPGASVRVSVYDWTSRKKARAYLQEAGVAVDEDEGTVVSEKVWIGYVWVVDDLENGGKPYVEVSFNAAR